MAYDLKRKFLKIIYLFISPLILRPFLKTTSAYYGIFI